MLRWLFLLLLLANALLFFWYAQQRAAEPEVKVSTSGGAGLRLLSELPANEVLPARERVCLSYAPLSSQYEAQRLESVLASEPVSTETVRLPAVVIGWRLVLPLPADAAQRIELLDALAREGWVPESRGGLLSFGRFPDLVSLNGVRNRLPPDLRERVQAEEIVADEAFWQVRVKHLAGYEISSEINQLVAASWPGIKIEKNDCEGVATPKGDQ
ncbi:hypothetical protein GCM10011352_40360 [Marinobacterium zhoushanense]|uniref:SPOR domain-containing protein n=1 Tax=Marinobacterium zhoushanense TaxID=1679163 RepID=A0ABQ1KSP2_9GAMM|nr:hypothetical protein [Marinobacterium zhoushanense]GGC09778.1 hypothetical protein GCM10011352_40360 [Marinobacterium zhoushanense]